MAKFKVQIDAAGRSVPPSQGPYGYGGNAYQFPASFEEIDAMTLVEKARRALNASPISLALPKDAGSLSPDAFLQRVYEVALTRCGTSEEALIADGGMEPDGGVSLSMNGLAVSPAQQACRAKAENAAKEAGKSGADSFFALTGSGN